MRAITERARRLAVLACVSFAASACGGGGSGSAPADPAPASRNLARGELSPGVRVEIVAITGGSGSGGFFRPGDRPSVRFTLTKSNGDPWGLAEMDFARILLSGPSFNYQRVIAEQSDVATRAKKQGDGSFVYTFADPLPEEYLVPYNDSLAFGAGDGEMAGQELLDGTYTVGLSVAWDYVYQGHTVHEAAETVGQLLVGGSATLVVREVTSTANCNACHVDLRAHGGYRKDVRVCVLCHTQGAEDLNDSGLAGGTPGVSISSRVLFHKLHSGKHLPSVLGVATLPNGTRNYAATPRPYLVVDGETGVHDYSEVSFPVWPNRAIAMPRDFGFDLLAPEAQAKDEEIRRGITRCDVCHGDPDGDGPIAAPALGTTIRSESSRAACGACHDDWDPALPYDNGAGSEMPPQVNDAICRECHEAEDDLTPSLSVRGGHEHPLVNPRLLPFLGEGVHAAITNVVPAGPADDHDGALDPGEKLHLTLAIGGDNGAGVAAATLKQVEFVLSGPDGNPNLVHEVAIPRALLTGTSPYDLFVPEFVALEAVGDSTPASGEVFTTARAPHHDVSGARTQVFTTNALGVFIALAADAPAGANFVDVADASGFARDDVVVLEPAFVPQREFLRVQRVDANRLWFSSPHTPAYPASLRLAHAAGTTVARVGLTELTAGVDYTLDANTGTITEIGDFGNGAAVVVSYLTDFVMPARYPVPANGSPDLGENAGEWAGKALVPGAYRAAISVTRDFDYFAPGQTTRYTASSPPASALVSVLASGATALPPVISTGANCLACHQDVYYHAENYRGFETCIACHGNAGMEDRPQYVSANAPATPGVATDFRALLHTIHMGSKLANAASFEVAGAGTAPFPDDFSVLNYARIHFPAEPRGPAECVKCHGAESTAWQQPLERDHPDGQTEPAQVWRVTCGACHDSTSARAHIDANTAPDGAEACLVCHGIGEDWNVALYHDVR